MTTTETSTPSDRIRVVLSVAVVACVLLVVWAANTSITTAKEIRQLKRDAELLEKIGQARAITSEITVRAMDDHERRMKQLRREIHMIKATVRNDNTETLD